MKIFCEPYTKQLEKTNNTVLNTVVFYLEGDDHKRIKINGEKLTFTLQLFEVELIIEFPEVFICFLLCWRKTPLSYNKHSW